MKTKATGKQVFNSLISYVKMNKIEYNGILGIWAKESDNTLVFNEMIIKGMTKEQAAFKTWTGQRALEHGFDKVIIDKLIPNTPPYNTINVKFYK